jgi:alanine dehydrogenase
MPGAVPRSASQALSSAITPYARLLAEHEVDDSSPLASGVNIRAGEIVHPVVAEALKG